MVEPVNRYKEGTLNLLYAYNATLVGLDEDFKKRISKGYTADKQ